METENPVVNLTTLSNNHLWFMEIVIGLLTLIAINFIFKRVVKHIRHRSLSMTHDWKEKIGEITFLPITILLWVLGGILVLEVLSKRFSFIFFDDYLDAFRTSCIVGCITWVIMRWKHQLQIAILDKERHTRKVDASFIHVVGKFATIVVMLITAMIVLQVWGVNLGPLIAFGGIGAAAIGFAAKDVIANFFGGLMLYITRPFMSGDYVVLPAQQLEGHVEEIGWYLTSIRDKEKRPVYLPNAIFSNVLVVNSSRMTHRRILEKIGVRYDDFPKMKNLCEEIKQAISEHSAIDTHLPVLVTFSAYNQYTLDISLDVYTLATKYDHYLAVKQEILILVYDVIKAKGAEMPFPTMTIQGALSPVPN
ncbi:MAG: mechanosensitive ion channel [Verrucomicrobia bacterium]|nr:mechanosensitive ion channel [Verrucomicrobiota bacterium]